MRKYFIILLTAVSLFTSSGLISKSAANRNKLILPVPTATPADSSESLLLLSAKEIIIPCPPGFLNAGECPDGQLIAVKTSGLNPIENKNVYKYEVTGGRILGKGKNVRWDLSKTRPGTYHITVSVSDGKNTREDTETVIVRECFCPSDCFCPALFVVAIGNGKVKAGETVDFSANVSGGSSGDINYTWTVSQGEIIDGQGTPEIKVKTTGKMSGTVKATVEIDGMCADCAKTASATAKIIK